MLACFAFLLAFLFSLSSGTSELGFTEIIQIFFKNSTPSVLKEIFFEFRLPKTITAVLAGMALSVSGLLMQTLFRNPLAGPYVLGITGGSNLMVALLLMSTTAAGIQFTTTISNFAIPLSAAVGAFLALLFILLISIKVHSSVSLLLAGLMLGFIYGAIQNILEFLASPEAIKRFTLWSMGSLGNVNFNQLFLFSIFIFPGIIFAFFLSKQLDLFLLGDDYSRSLGINIVRFRWFVVLITAVLTGVTVAYCGPIAFIGLAVPHVTRMIWQTPQHRILIPASAFAGATMLMLCDGIGNLFSNYFLIPINIVTSLIGAPFVLFLLFRKTKIQLE